MSHNASIHSELSFSGGRARVADRAKFARHRPWPVDFGPNPGKLWPNLALVWPNLVRPILVGCQPNSAEIGPDSSSFARVGAALVPDHPSDRDGMRVANRSMIWKHTPVDRGPRCDRDFQTANIDTCAASSLGPGR